MVYGPIKHLIPAQPGWYAKRIVETMDGREMPAHHAVVAWAVVDCTDEEDDYNREGIVGFVHWAADIANAEEMPRFDEYVFDLGRDPMDSW